MATTDARAGFRLPWSSEQRPATDETSPDGEGENHDPRASIDWPASDNVATETDEASPVETKLDTHDEPVAQVDAAADEAVDRDGSTDKAAAHKKPSKFLADLTKAMQATAEDARTRTLTQLQADAKAHIEQIHARSATEAADLRRTADDDLAAVREWSKAEIARIREESEQRIADRKTRLEGEIEGHAALIEREIEHVQGQVSAFEADMAAFFERLLAEEDPTKFATMAETLPEPPPFEPLSAAELAALPVAASPEADTADADEADAPEASAQKTEDGEAQAEAGEAEDGEAEATADVVEGQAEAVAGDQPSDGEGAPQAEAGEAHVADGAEGELDRESAYAAIQAAAEAAASAELAADAADRAEAVAEVAIEIVGHGGEGEGEGEGDPRVAALGLSTDFDAAEAEAMASAEAVPAEGGEITELSDDAVAARLAGLVPGKGGKAASGDAKSTQVIVTGLVSVASIASFKRHLGRVAGVQSVGVSSGPDGEFVFAVNHGADAALREAIPSLPSFQARVTGTGEGTISVTAHDPESGE